MTVEHRITYIADDGTKFDTAAECKDYENEQSRLQKEKEQQLSNAFLDNVGFNISQYKTEKALNQAISHAWVIFDKKGHIKGLKICGGELLERDGIKCDFRYVIGEKDDLETLDNWLRENKLYGHALSSFTDRNPEFYKLDMLYKLHNLGWKVENNRLVNTNW